MWCLIARSTLLQVIHCSNPHNVLHYDTLGIVLGQCCFEDQLSRIVRRYTICVTLCYVAIHTIIICQPLFPECNLSELMLQHAPLPILLVNFCMLHVLHVWLMSYQPWLFFSNLSWPCVAHCHWRYMFYDDIILCNYRTMFYARNT